MERAVTHATSDVLAVLTRHGKPSACVPVMVVEVAGRLERIGKGPTTPSGTHVDPERRRKDRWTGRAGKVSQVSRVNQLLAVQGCREQM